nr:RDD family protein [Cohnella sp. CFH 77786]
MTDQSIARPAGFWIRFYAQILDGIIVSVPLALISFLVTGSWNDNIFNTIVSLLYTLLLPILWNGYTIGKRLAGIRIAKVNGENLGLGTMLMRNIVGGLIYGITVGIAAIVSAFMVGLREDKRSIHDFIAGTYVTKAKR